MNIVELWNFMIRFVCFQIKDYLLLSIKINRNRTLVVNFLLLLNYYHPFYLRFRSLLYTIVYTSSRLHSHPGFYLLEFRLLPLSVCMNTNKPYLIKVWIIFVSVCSPRQFVHTCSDDVLQYNRIQ